MSMSYTCRGDQWAADRNQRSRSESAPAKFMSQSANTLDRLVASARQFYSLPAVAMQVLELTNNPSVDTHALKQCLENDPALTTKVLRVVNSSLFGLSRQVSDLNQALAMLGTKPLKLLVLGFSLPPELFRGVAGDMLASYWRHTLTKAVAAREIAETLWRQSGDEAFLAGLLQDLGMLLLIQELGPPYVDLLRKIHLQGEDLLSWERRSLGFDHATLTARILEHWGLPAALVDAVEVDSNGQGEDDSSAETRDLRQILELAELVSQLLADERSEALPELLQYGKHACNLTSARLDGLVSTLEEKVQQLADVLSLQLPQGVDYIDVLSCAHRQLAEAASELAVEWVADRHGDPGKRLGQAARDEMQTLCSAVADVAREPARQRTVAASVPTAERPVAATVSHGATAVSTMSPVGSLAAPAGSVAPDDILLARLGATAAACRQSRCALSLLLVELVGTSELVFTAGADGVARLRQVLETACRQLDHPNMICLPHSEAGFAIILPDCERRAAVELGNTLIDRLRGLAQMHRAGRSLRGIAVGAATVSLPPRNFPAEELFSAADRCRYGSHASGGGVVKSIEIY